MSSYHENMIPYHFGILSMYRVYSLADKGPRVGELSVGNSRICCSYLQCRIRQMNIFPVLRGTMPIQVFFAMISYILPCLHLLPFP
jgi:hypothetical protein